MVSHKVVTPVKTGVQSFSNYPKTLDSGIRRNDGISQFLAFYGNIKHLKAWVLKHAILRRMILNLGHCFEIGASNFEFTKG
jgi:hypothetical protein